MIACAMPEKLEWRPTGGVAALVYNERGRKLMLMVTAVGTEWMAVALETPDEDQKSLEQVFDNHAHASIAENVSLETAMTVSAAYAEAWVAGDQEAMERCKCIEIAAEGPFAEPPSDLFVRKADPDSLELQRLTKAFQRQQTFEINQQIVLGDVPHDLNCDLDSDCTCGAKLSADPDLHPPAS